MTSAILAFPAALAITFAAHAQTLPDTVDVIPLPLPPDAWVWAGSPPGDPTRLFVMEGGGTVRVLDITPPATPGGLKTFTLRAAPFASVPSAQARSVAFAPDFATSGRLYIAYQLPSTNSSRVVEVRTSQSDPTIADPATLRTIKDFPGLNFDHALGSMHFGPDGYLYLGVGEDQNDSNAQLITNPLGKMLRIDVNGDDFPEDATRNYRVPPDNPLVGREGAATEIWHIGLRNPWRWSFDRWNNDTWIADVGGAIPGEINVIPAGAPPYRNFGWPRFDGTNPFGGAIHPDFTLETLTPPTLHIARTGNQCSTSGGALYRGNALRPWRGRYVWGDACSRQVYSARYTGNQLTDVQNHTPQLLNHQTQQPVNYGSISMIAEDADGELYILTATRGTSGSGIIHRIVPAGPQPPLADLGSQGGVIGPDTLFDNNDFIAFIDLFFANDPRADMGAQGGIQAVDQRLDNNDFIAFIDAFFSEQ